MLNIEALTVKDRLVDITCQAFAGQFVHVMGNNGSGKSSLLHVIAGLLAGQCGRVEVLGQNLTQFSPGQLANFRCLQEQHHPLVFGLTVAEALDFFTQGHNLPSELVSALDIAEFLERPMQSLSGGEHKRVEIARVLLQVWPALQEGKALILLDEPTQGLDFKHQHWLFKQLQTFAELGNVVIVSHHDLNLCQRYANFVWLMDKGRLVASLSALDELSDSQLSQIFSCPIQSYSHAHGHKIFQTYLEDRR
jgi:vitamin B12 transport system ATP-binding protein